jgi:peptide deformylase
LGIRTYGDPVLRAQAEPVARIDQTVEQLVQGMVETMYEDHGVGLAAPQVGTSQRLIVVDLSLGQDQDHPLPMINPRIGEAEGEEALEEGCLSLPDIYETVVRAARITVAYQDLAGEGKQMDCNGLLARIVQHETDHLDGMLFVDRISLLKRQLLGARLRRLAREGGRHATQSSGKVLI